MFQIHSAPRSHAGLSLSIMLHVGFIVLITTGLLAFAPSTTTAKLLPNHMVVFYLTVLPPPDIFIEPAMVDAPKPVKAKLAPKLHVPMSTIELKPVVNPTPLQTLKPAPTVVPTPVAPVP